MNRRIRKKRNQHKPNGTTYTQHRKNIKIIKRIVRLTKKRARIISFSYENDIITNMQEGIDTMAQLMADDIGMPIILRETTTGYESRAIPLGPSVSFEVNIVRGHRLSNEDIRNSEMLADQYIDFRETFK